MKILRVNMTTLTTTWEELSGKWRMLGNRALNAKILLKEVDPACEPLGIINWYSPTSSGCHQYKQFRAPVRRGQEPLTGGIKESNAGGTGGRYLARQGIRAVIVEGKPREEGPYVLYIGDGGAKIHPAVDLEGLGNYRTAQVLRERYGHDASVICIGQAGEMVWPRRGVQYRHGRATGTGRGRRPGGRDGQQGAQGGGDCQRWQLPAAGGGSCGFPGPQEGIAWDDPIFPGHGQALSPIRDGGFDPQHQREGRYADQ